MNANDKIAELAYHLWDGRGRPHGSAEQDWLEAERQLGRTMDASLAATFPASDPPSSHTPDEPPANADDKWRAAGKSRKSTAAGGAERRTATKPQEALKATPRKAPRARKSANPPVDETDDGPATAPGDTGE